LLTFVVGFGVEAANAVWDLVLPLINEKGRYSDDVPIAAAVCVCFLNQQLFFLKKKNF